MGIPKLNKTGPITVNGTKFNNDQPVQKYKF